jgi:hypothetical protein
MKIQLKLLNGTNTELEIESAETTTVNSLRSRVAIEVFKLNESETSRVRLIFLGKVLKDNSNLSSYLVEENSIIHSILKAENKNEEDSTTNQNQTSSSPNHNPNNNSTASYNVNNNSINNNINNNSNSFGLPGIHHRTIINHRLNPNPIIHPHQFFDFHNQQQLHHHPQQHHHPINQNPYQNQHSSITVSDNFNGIVENSLGIIRSVAQSPGIVNYNGMLSNLNNYNGNPANSASSILWDLSVMMNNLAIPINSLSNQLSNGSFASISTVEQRVSRQTQIQQTKILLDQLASASTRVSEALGELQVNILNPQSPPQPNNFVNMNGQWFPNFPSGVNVPLSVPISQLPPVVSPPASIPSTSPSSNIASSSTSSSTSPSISSSTTSSSPVAPINNLPSTNNSPIIKSTNQTLPTESFNNNIIGGNATITDINHPAYNQIASSMSYSFPNSFPQSSTDELISTPANIQQNNLHEQASIQQKRLQQQQIHRQHISQQQHRQQIQIGPPSKLISKNWHDSSSDASKRRIIFSHIHNILKSLARFKDTPSQALQQLAQSIEIEFYFNSNSCEEFNNAITLPERVEKNLAARMGPVVNIHPI